MAEERFLVTGAFGCIGAWTVKQLVHDGARVWAYDLPGQPQRLELIMTPEELAEITVLAGDIADQQAFERIVVDEGITHICHLAALQVPFVRADPVVGARVNVVGTAVVMETARRHAEQIQGLTYCSSVAVYPHPDRCPPGPLAHDTVLGPENMYGVYKQCNEGMAGIYWLENKLPSIGLRPCVVYGPGRDQGWTSLPTKAMLAAAAGRSYHMDFGGTILYQYTADAAAVIVQATRACGQGAGEGAPVFNMGGTTASMAEIVQAIESATPKSAGKITFDDTQIAIPKEVQSTALDERIGRCNWRGLHEGVAETIDLFRKAIQDEKIDVDKILGG